ncbi:uncharacterized protein LAESUDRAFT_688689 [Laetiporus sulphureus 93-53]|uniref:Lytic polysaccharide monooxygenase n=1 Tax=Laetiporus sulphureus 93-53 TaxID=1314785 RepID=A0A165B0G4_9APHY|nr:uncharacterized protein LAESUDRAFT_688689 [Laetiporus sulphureus 93-53]KZS99995.1 hypothetical protein LAESUDRAFT_688689 [Laetiporus sulphureus 93-53]
MFAFIKSLILFGILAASVHAQWIYVDYPAAGTTVSAGSNITVLVAQPVPATPSIEVGLAICLKSCAGYSDGCASFDTTQQLGDILYIGPYDPVYHSTEWPPYQNFTVQIPASMSAGEASLSATHLALIGAGPEPFMQVGNETIIIAS